MIERWLPVVGFEGLYEVSDQGRVRSLDRWVDAGGVKLPGCGLRFRQGVVLKPQRHSGGYVQFTLRGRTRLAHNLVLAAFVGSRPAGQEGCHADGNKSNNALSNLYYGTPSKNAEDKKRHGTDTFGCRNGAAKLTEADVNEIRSWEGILLQKDIAVNFGISQTQVSRILSRRHWRHV
ncbi:MAG: NUMOD4 domain-containing protein [Methylorubrum rhodinum]|uniref:NUMOD4 domain-containing protein n=1 Tax=Methylorubrum rhodinum TaxID=29428 RepID=UPI003BB0CC49